MGTKWNQTTSWSSFCVGSLWIFELCVQMWTSCSSTRLQRSSPVRRSQPRSCSRSRSVTVLRLLVAGLYSTSSLENLVFICEGGRLLNYLRVVFVFYPGASGSGQRSAARLVRTAHLQVSFPHPLRDPTALLHLHRLRSLQVSQTPGRSPDWASVNYSQ